MYGCDTYGYGAGEEVPHQHKHICPYKKREKKQTIRKCCNTEMSCTNVLNDKAPEPKDRPHGKYCNPRCSTAARKHRARAIGKQHNMLYVGPRIQRNGKRVPNQTQRGSFVNLLPTTNPSAVEVKAQRVVKKRGFAPANPFDTSTSSSTRYSARAKLSISKPAQAPASKNKSKGHQLTRNEITEATFTALYDTKDKIDGAILDLYGDNQRFCALLMRAPRTYQITALIRVSIRGPGQ